MIDLYVDAETERDGFDVAAVMSEDKCKQYASALMKLVVGLKSSSWSTKDFLSSFLSESARDVIAKMMTSGSELDEATTSSQRLHPGDDSSVNPSSPSPRPRMSTATKMMQPDYKRQSISSYAEATFSKKNTKWSKFHSVQVRASESRSDDLETHILRRSI